MLLVVVHHHCVVVVVAAVAAGAPTCDGHVDDGYNAVGAAGRAKALQRIFYGLQLLALVARLDERGLSVESEGRANVGAFEA